MTDLIDPSPVKLIDIEHLLDDSEQGAYSKLLDSGFTKREIKICVRRKPLGQYLSYFEQKHPMLFDDYYRFHTTILQHVQNVRQWLKEDCKPADEWMSHGYVLAWLHYKCDRLHLVETVISKEMSRRASNHPRVRKNLPKKAIQLVLGMADVKDFGFGMAAFRDQVAECCTIQTSDGEIEITPITSESDRVTRYLFEYRGEDGSMYSDFKSVGAIRAVIKRLKGSR